MKRLYLPALALLLLLTAILSGAAVSRRFFDDGTAARALDSSLGRLGSIVADILWMQLDDYHHLEMYQGLDWTTNTKYLPQLWLITRLNPDLVDAYLTGGNHLAVNLGMPEEGIALLQRGLRNCPDDTRLVWEYTAVLWLTDYLGPRATQEAAWRFLNLIRRRRGDIEEIWNEPNAELVLRGAFNLDSTRMHSDRISVRYLDRSEFIRDAGRNAIWPRI